MPEFDFSVLYDKYPTLIGQMPETFTAHQFILKLAEEYQAQYIEALYAYRLHQHRGRPAPFLIVHGILAQRLLSHPELVRQTQPLVSSRDIFGNLSSCSEWLKLK
jgi:hypothetical protein